MDYTGLMKDETASVAAERAPAMAPDTVIEAGRNDATE